MGQRNKLLLRERRGKGRGARDSYSARGGPLHRLFPSFALRPGHERSKREQLAETEEPVPGDDLSRPPSDSGGSRCHGRSATPRHLAREGRTPRGSGRQGGVGAHGKLRAMRQPFERGRATTSSRRAAQPSDQDVRGGCRGQGAWACAFIRLRRREGAILRLRSPGPPRPPGSPPGRTPRTHPAPAVRQPSTASPRRAPDRARCQVRVTFARTRTAGP